MNKKKLSMKKTSNIFKFIGGLFCIGLILFKVIKYGDLTFDYALACGVASIIIANIFITVDIAVWRDNLNKLNNIDDKKE
jgi:hypothetical protein